MSNKSQKPDVREVGHTGRCDFSVISRSMNIPADCTVQAMTAPVRAIIRFAGGCKGMDAVGKDDMVRKVLAMHSGFRGVSTSGATAQRENTKLGERNDVATIDPMVTDLAVLIDSHYCMGTVPRTGQMHFEKFGLLCLDRWGTNPNLRMNHIVVVEDDNTDTNLEWNGDLDKYMRWMQKLQDEANFKLVLFVWNGGPVTLEESLAAADLGWTVIVIRDSGRAAEDLATKPEYAGFRSRPNVHTFSKDNIAAVRSLYQREGILE